ncbi:hypothetical protein PF005_g17570 [Phytophthora fragariae]|uniref:Uncharacterized protein n=1 Tax=Phytophthora fragariae TaxID=53985 RepID=A0A6A3T203_9STRA|nr:hypothetical protein PF003_g38255 [Phytophthora fragariae]KAE8943749.1 hypothetical protein PF009_g6537 [Phytophthora fragariae]KAE9007647.1 hypothetical protein PF011_g11048 [Phytophthora fragariae]KAE9082865.1 hypothetical protein PF007_g22139 [Phytophthora fragariae]KAE9109550.1 hypothetical protein PF010_g11496 [Phytophthora fragariae]
MQSSRRSRPDLCRHLLLGCGLLSRTLLKNMSHPSTIHVLCYCHIGAVPNSRSGTYRV